MGAKEINTPKYKVRGGVAVPKPKAAKPVVTEGKEEKPTKKKAKKKTSN